MEEREINELSKGCICQILNASEPDGVKNYVVQILQKERYVLQQSTSYSLKLSDGVFTIKAMLKKKEKDFTGGKFDILNMSHFHCSDNKGKKFLILYQYPEVLYTGIRGIIGRPDEYINQTYKQNVIDKIDAQIPSTRIKLSLEEKGRENLLAKEEKKQTTNNESESKREENNSLKPITRIEKGTFKASQNQSTESPILPQNPENQENASKKDTKMEIDTPNNQKPLPNQPTESLHNFFTVKTQVPKIPNFPNTPKEAKEAPANYKYIKDLQIFESSDWTLKARITKKSGIKHWKNKNGEGYLIALELIDEQKTQITATLFTEAVDKFNAILKQNQVYYFSTGKVKPANTRYTSIQNKLSLIFDQFSTIALAQDDLSLPQIGFNFCDLKDIVSDNVKENSMVDAIGVVISADNPKSFLLKDGRNVEKRILQIVDESESKIEVTLWRGLGNAVDFNEHPVMAFKSVKVREFRGAKVLSTHDETSVLVNPQHHRTLQLKDWYEKNKSLFDTLNEPSNAKHGNFTTAGYKMIGEILKEIEGPNRQKHFSNVYQTSGQIFFIGSDKPFYIACSICKKKVFEELDLFKCEHCMKFVEPEVTYIFDLNIGDSTGNIWIKIFGNLGDRFFQMSAQEFYKIYQSGNSRQIYEILYSSKWHSFTFYLNPTIDEFTQQLKFRTNRIEPNNYFDLNKECFKRLKIYSQKEQPVSIPEEKGE